MASHSNAKHVLQECVDRRCTAAGRANVPRSQFDSWQRNDDPVRRRHEPEPDGVRQQETPNGDNDYGVVSDINRIVIVLRNRRRVVVISAAEFGRDVVVDGPMAVTVPVACVMVGVCRSVAIRMPRQMHVRPNRVVSRIG